MTNTAQQIEKAFALGFLLGAAPFRSSKLAIGERRKSQVDIRQFWARHYLSWRYIRGEGIEIGALHQPLSLYHGAKARYVDRYSAANLRFHYPELVKLPIVEPDIIDDGENLSTINLESVDFIVANHFLEHCQNPIATIKTHLSKLKPGGILFLAVPLWENSFDSKRKKTTIEHLVKDFEQGPEWSRNEHYMEWAELVHNVPTSDISAEATRLMNENYSIHFHVWSYRSFLEFLTHLQKALNFPFQIEMNMWWKYNPVEGLFMLRKLW